MFDKNKSNVRNLSSKALRDYSAALKKMGAGENILDNPPSVELKKYHGNSGEFMKKVFYNLERHSLVLKRENNGCDERDLITQGISRFVSEKYGRPTGMSDGDPEDYVEEILGNLLSHIMGKPPLKPVEFPGPEKVVEETKKDLEECPNGYHRDWYVRGYSQEFNKRIGEITASEITQKGFGKFLRFVKKETGEGNLYRIPHKELLGAIQEFSGIYVTPVDVKSDGSTYSFPYITRYNGYGKPREEEAPAVELAREASL